MCGAFQHFWASHKQIGTRAQDTKTKSGSATHNQLELRTLMQSTFSLGESRWSTSRPMPSTIKKSYCQSSLLSWQAAIDAGWKHLTNEVSIIGLRETLPVLYIHRILIFILADAWLLRIFRAPGVFRRRFHVDFAPSKVRYAGVIPNVFLVLYPYIDQISRLFILLR